MPASQRISTTVRAENLPREIAAKLPTPPIPGMRYRVTAELVEESEEERALALRADITEGIADLEAGRLVDGDEVFGELEATWRKAP